MTTRALLVLALWVIAGCHKPSPTRCPADAPLVEIRDATGVLVERVHGQAGGASLLRCDAVGTIVGRVETSGGVRTVLDTAGKMTLRLERSGDDVSIATADGTRYRLWSGPRELRLLTPGGVPIGSVTEPPPDDPEHTRVAVRQASGAVAAFIEPLGAGFLVRALDGTGLVAATPASRALPVGLLALPGLGDGERRALYLVWSR